MISQEDDDFDDIADFEKKIEYETFFTLIVYFRDFFLLIAQLYNCFFT